MSSMFRGANVTPLVEAGFLESLLAKRANLIRYQIVGFTPVPPATTLEWNLFIAQHLDHIENVVIPTIAGRAALIIDMHWDAPDRELFITTWELIATRFRNNVGVAGYGILNEPAKSVTACNSLMARVARHIYAIDKRKNVIATSPYADPVKFKTIKPIAKPKEAPAVWYEAHMYYPMKLTHQGVYPQYPIGPEYPNNRYNKEVLRKYLQPVRNFQIKNKAKIYIGEFGISWYASEASRKNYLRDCMAIFEEYNWRYTLYGWEPGIGQPFTINDNEEVASVVYRKWNKNV